MAQKEATLLLKIKETGSKALDKVSDGLKKIGEVGKAAFLEIGAVIGLAIHNYEEQEKAVNQLNQSLVNQGIYTKKLSDEYQNLATQFQKKSQFGDEEIIQAQSTLQAYLGQTKVSKELIQATLDLAAAKGIDLKSASDLMGKSIGTSTNALQRQGIALDENLSKNEKLAQVIEKVNQKYKGQAEASIQGLGGLTLLKNAASDLFETLGQRLVPVVEFAVTNFMSFFDTIQGSSSFFDLFERGVIGISKGIIFVIGTITAFGQAFGATFGTISGALSQLADKNFAMAWETIKSGASGVKDDVTKTFDEMNAKMVELDDKYLAQKEENLLKEQELIRASNEQKTLMMQEQAVIDDEFMATKSEEEIAKMQLQLDLKNNLELQAQIQNLNNTIKHETDKSKVIAAENEKRKLMDKAMLDAKMQNMTFLEKLETMSQDKRFQASERSMSQLSRMQDSKNKELVAIGKAAAIAGIITDTARGVMGIQAWANAIPFVGPALAMGLSAALIAYGAEQIGRVTSAQMAEGGIVKSQPGGMLATIGEGGKDEAVIPLDDERTQEVLGRGINITIYGGLLGDQTSARELAIALDKELLNLRQANQSLSMPGVL